jgi:hypothetical protein
MARVENLQRQVAPRRDDAQKSEKKVLPQPPAPGVVAAVQGGKVPGCHVAAARISRPVQQIGKAHLAQHDAIRIDRAEEESPADTVALVRGIAQATQVERRAPHAENAADALELHPLKVQVPARLVGTQSVDDAQGREPLIPGGLAWASVTSQSENNRAKAIPEETRQPVILLLCIMPSFAAPRSRRSGTGGGSMQPNFTTSSSQVMGIPRPARLFEEGDMRGLLETPQAARWPSGGSVCQSK